MYRLRQFSLRALFLALLAIAVIAVLVRPRPSRFARSLDTEFLSSLVDTPGDEAVLIGAGCGSWHRKLQTTVSCTPQNAELLADRIEHSLITAAHVHSVSYGVTSRGFGSHKGASFRYNADGHSGTFDVWLTTERRVYGNDTELCDFELMVTIHERRPKIFFDTNSHTHTQDN